MKRTMTHMGMMTAAAAMIGLDSTAMATDSICSISAESGAGDYGDGEAISGAGGGITQTMTSEAIGDNTPGYTDDGSGAGGQMYQAMSAAGLGDPEPGADDNKVDEQQQQGADAVEQPDAPEGNDGEGA